MFQTKIRTCVVALSLVLLGQQKVSACDWRGTPKGKELYDLLLGHTGAKYNIFEGYGAIYTPLYGVHLDRLACQSGYRWYPKQGTMKLTYMCFYDSDNPYAAFPKVPIDHVTPIALPPDGSGDCGPGSTIGSSGQKTTSAEFSFIQEEGIEGWLATPETVSNTAASGLMF